MNIYAGKVTSQVWGQVRRSKQLFRNIREREWEQAPLCHHSGQDPEAEMKIPGSGQEGAWVGVPRWGCLGQVKPIGALGTLMNLTFFLPFTGRFLWPKSLWQVRSAQWSWKVDDADYVENEHKELVMSELAFKWSNYEKKWREDIIATAGWMKPTGTYDSSSCCLLPRLV